MNADALCYTVDQIREKHNSRLNLDYGVKGMKWGIHRSNVWNRMSKDEQGMVYHNINTYYFRMGLDKRVGRNCGMEIGNNYYVFTNYEMGSYSFRMKIDLEKHRDLIEALKERYK